MSVNDVMASAQQCFPGISVFLLTKGFSKAFDGRILRGGYK